MSSLYILEIRPLSEVSLASTFSHMVGVVHLPMEYYTAERNKELLTFVTARMELESIMLSEISQTAKDKWHMISPISGTYSKKKQTGNKI